MSQWIEILPAALTHSPIFAGASVALGVLATLFYFSGVKEFLVMTIPVVAVLATPLIR